MKKKLVAVVLAGTMLAGCMTGFAGCKGSGDPNTFTWFAVTGEPLFYRDYNENPVVEYVTKYKTFNGENGEESISFEFNIPASDEAARESFSNKINSRNFEDVMDPTMYDGSLADLYENDVILDLTQYVTDPEVMPNLSKFISENPDLVPYMQTPLSDGTRAFLKIPSVADGLDDTMQAFGYNYRRDWLIKYGTQPETFFDPMTDDAPRSNPKAGEKFTGAFTERADGTRLPDSEIEYTNDTALPEGMNGDSWEDDLLFPSGNKHPVYISDWQWMFEIYERALEAENINDDAYVMSLFYPGYIANGDFVSGFGGGGPLLYKDKEDHIALGTTGQGFRAYLECMNDWYERGWIDQYFNSKTEPFYQTDNERVAAGKVPVWMGNASRLGTRLVNDDSGYEKTQGAIVFGAATPINDIPAYDGDPQTSDYSKQVTAEEAREAMNGGEGSAYMMQTPYCIFQNERMGGGVVISKSAEQKNLKLLLSFFDYFYSEEGALLLTIGLNKEQYELTQNKTYAENGLVNGAYTVIEENGETKYLVDQAIVTSTRNLESAAKARVIPGLTYVTKRTYGYADSYIESRHQWTKYEATGFLGAMINGQLSPEASELGGDVYTPLEQNYLYKNVYKFVKGETPLDDASWATFCAGVMNFKNKGKTVNDLLQSYETLFDELYR